MDLKKKKKKLIDETDIQGLCLCPPEKIQRTFHNSTCVPSKVLNTTFCSCFFTLIFLFYYRNFSVYFDNSNQLGRLINGLKRQWYMDPVHGQKLH